MFVEKRSTPIQPPLPGYERLGSNHAFTSLTDLVGELSLQLDRLNPELAGLNRLARMSLGGAEFLVMELTGKYCFIQTSEDQISLPLLYLSEDKNQSNEPFYEAELIDYKGPGVLQVENEAEERIYEIDSNGKTRGRTFYTRSWRIVSPSCPERMSEEEFGILVDFCKALVNRTSSPEPLLDRFAVAEGAIIVTKIDISGAERFLRAKGRIFPNLELVENQLDFESVAA
ncbi:hypothetical protein MUP65_00145 [Patescibacteria group bacterium]|nr:hypothetical protein [Patescibacteria group bacterium]